MANLISKTYEIRNKDDELEFMAILQFPEFTDVKHWERIATVIATLLSKPEDPLGRTPNTRDLIDHVADYVAQHHESGFTIIFITEREADYHIRI